MSTSPTPSTLLLNNHLSTNYTSLVTVLSTYQHGLLLLLIVAAQRNLARYISYSPVLFVSLTKREWCILMVFLRHKILDERSTFRIPFLDADCTMSCALLMMVCSLQFTTVLVARVTSSAIVVITSCYNRLKTIDWQFTRFILYITLIADLASRKQHQHMSMPTPATPQLQQPPLRWD
jgi:hypothetical protein